MNQDEQQAQSILCQMTLDEKIALITGVDGMYTKGVPRLNVRRIRMADATMGLRDDSIPATAFPAPILLTSTWDRSMAHQYGATVASEFRAAGVDVLLGPGVNIYRVPQCGRNFEYFGEDPILSAQMSSEYIKGAQSQGVAATVKHFVANNTDWHRCSSNSVIDERTFREVYLPAFESAVKDAEVLSVMTSYNLLNGEYTAECHRLVSDILLDEWAFEGVVMSDWEGTWSTEKAFNSGLHLEMPGNKTWSPEQLKPLLENGSLSPQELDAKCLALLKWSFAIDRIKAAAPKATRRCPAHAQVALEVARKGVVLLKNERALLPLKLKGGQINVVGPYASSTPTGGGAARVEPVDPNSILGSLSDLSPEADVIRGELKMESAAAVIVCVGFNEKIEHEGSDRPFELPWEHEALVRRCAKANPNTIVVLFGGGGIGMDTWVDEVAAVLHAWYPGEKGGLAVAEILLGLVNPSGKLPISIERRWEDAPAFANYIPNGAAIYETPDYVGRGRPQLDVHYEEGVFCGYRHYDKTGTAPLFPFGHGLSYTTFGYSDLKLTQSANGEVEVAFTVQNTGAVAGREIAQIYVGDVQASVPRPLRELKGFEAVSLKPGESAEVKVALGQRVFSFYDVASKQWRLEPGEFLIEVGASARDLRLKGRITL